MLSNFLSEFNHYISWHVFCGICKSLNYDIYSPIHISSSVFTKRWRANDNHCCASPLKHMKLTPLPAVFCARVVIPLISLDNIYNYIIICHIGMLQISASDFLGFSTQVHATAPVVRGHSGSHRPGQLEIISVSAEEDIAD